MKRWKNLDNANRQSREKVNEGRKQEEERIEKEAVERKYVEEATLAQEGKWEEANSFFFTRRIINKYKEAERWEELRKINEKVKTGLRQEQENKRKAEREYVREATQAKEGAWKPEESYFYEFYTGKRDGKNRESERFETLNKMNAEARKEKYDNAKRESNNQPGNEEDTALQALGLKREGLTEEALKKSYRSFVKKYHSDNFVHLNLTSEEQGRREELFKTVSPGYESLMRKARG